MAKIKKRYHKLFDKARQIQKPFVDWANSLPFFLKIIIGIVSGILGIIGLTNPLIPAWFFLPISGQVLFSQRKKISRTTVDFRQKTIRFIMRKRDKIIRRTKKLGNTSLYNQCIYKQRLSQLLHIND